MIEMRPPLEEFIRRTSEPGCSWGMADSDVVEICEYALQLESENARLCSERDTLAEKAKLYDYMQEVAKANGFDCLTDAITKANAYGKERDSLAEQLAAAETAMAIEVAEANKIAEDNAVLRLQLAAAVEGLRPFAEAASSEWCAPFKSGDQIVGSTIFTPFDFGTGDLRQAARILASLGSYGAASTSEPQKKESET